MEELEFEVRVCTSGSSGVAFYIPATIVKVLNLKDGVNTKISAAVDEDGDIVIYTSEIAGDEDDD